MPEQNDDSFHAEKFRASDPIKIKGFKLYNGGAFVCKGKVNWYPGDHYTPAVPNNGINTGNSAYIDLQKYKVPQGSFVSLYIDIVWGKDRSTGPWYECDYNSSLIVEFTITGTTFNSHVSPPSIISTGAQAVDA